jgi:hypothetical protein
MGHPLYDVTDFAIVGPFTLWVQFDDQTKQTINFEPDLFGELYGPLRELSVFNQVRLDQETRTLVWPNDADFDPWMLHEWPRLVDKLVEQARTWEVASEPAQ